MHDFFRLSIWAELNPPYFDVFSFGHFESDYAANGGWYFKRNFCLCKFWIHNKLFLLIWYWTLLSNINGIPSCKFWFLRGLAGHMRISCAPLFFPNMWLIPIKYSIMKLLIICVFCESRMITIADKFGKIAVVFVTLNLFWMNLCIRR